MKFTATYEELNKLIFCYTKEMNVEIQLQYHAENACIVKANFNGFRLNWTISNPTVNNNAISFNNNAEGLFSFASVQGGNESPIVDLNNGLISINLNPILLSKNVPLQIESLVFSNTGIDIKANVKD